VFKRDTKSFKEYQERFHLLLEAQLEYSSTEKGTQATFEDLRGNSAPFPRGLGGISGCSVWQIGDLDVPIDDWGQKQPKIVAVQTGVYYKDQAIKATRWIGVSTFNTWGISETSFSNENEFVAAIIGPPTAYWRNFPHRAILAHLCRSVKGGTRKANSYQILRWRVAVALKCLILVDTFRSLFSYSIYRRNRAMTKKPTTKFVDTTAIGGDGGVTSESASRVMS